MREIRINCPHCGQSIDISISDAGDLFLRHFDIVTDSETVEFIRGSGYEFGKMNRKEV